ncbi:MAG: hypothetical protein NXH75_04460 [Halobacteriovoraceae bacterium]|nr:hypothetical protein [Halobacteriovoraceae bacterium]
MIKNSRKTLFLSLILCFFADSKALEFGSERFVEFTGGAADYPVLVGMGHDPSINSNMSFTDQGFVTSMRNYPFPEGAGHKYFVANMMNFQGNYVMAGAKTDPRSPAFIMNSMDEMLTNPQAEIELIEGINASKLGAAQAGENAKRYIASEIIEPNPGYYQSADNQQAFESAYDNVLLGKAEEALFDGDEVQSSEYFKQQLEEYKNQSDKQTTAQGYQKNALLRQKKTAEKFRDFFQMKATISQQNLDTMPTKGSLVNNCQQNTPQNENPMAVYTAGMPQDEIDFYGFQPPSYPFDFCEQYVHNEESYLIQNLPVHDQLNTLVEDSTEMAQGLDEISQELSRRDMSLEEIAAVLSGNQAWQKLSKRALAYKECKKVKCLDPAEKALGKLVNFPGAEKHRSLVSNEIRAMLQSVIENGALPGSNENLLSKLGKEGSKKLKKIVSQKHVHKKAKESENIDELIRKKAAGREPASGSQKVYYKGKRFPRGGGYFRGEDGVLRGPSGRPVQGYANKPGTSLWDIISRRYMLKMRDEL